MNMQFIEGFLETVQHKSIAKASTKLRISHPALSKQIRTLEAYYGVKLFNRSAAGVVLTEAGKMLYTRIVPVFAELNAIQSDLANMNSIRKITLGTLPSLAAHYLPEIVYALEKRDVEVNLNVRNTSHELYEQLNNGEIDAAVLERPPVHTSVWNIDLFDEPYYAIVYPKHRLATHSSVTLQEIGNEPLILNPPDCSTRRTITSLMKEHGLEPQIKAEVNFGEFILGYVAAGAGITFVPKIVADRLGNPQLICIPLEDIRAKRTVTLISASDSIGKFLYPSFKGKR
jgi:LysR family transcriptional activator of glutamate synthase operon